MSGRLEEEILRSLVRCPDVAELSFEQLMELAAAEEKVQAHLPENLCRTDPRNGDRVLYTTARAGRPHDTSHSAPPGGAVQRECVICRGQTTGVVDIAALSEGFTFINLNLFPVLYPDPPGEVLRGGQAPAVPEQREVRGAHFLQWTSSLHDRDWHNLPTYDLLVVMKRLAALERTLLAGAAAGETRCVSIIKNHGRLVGGSLSHGHQQIIVSDVSPRRFEENLRFLQERGRHFSAYMLDKNPAGLSLRDYGPAVLLVPYFMRRPGDMLLLFKDPGKSFLYELSEAELDAAGRGWQEAIRTLRALMPRLGRETAYSVITHSGPGAGLYFEFLPYTQEIGGLEQLGLWLCQETPEQAAALLREILADAAGKEA